MSVSVGVCKKNLRVCLNYGISLYQMSTGIEPAERIAFGCVFVSLYCCLCVCLSVRLCVCACACMFICVCACACVCDCVAYDIHSMMKYAPKAGLKSQYIAPPKLWPP